MLGAPIQYRKAALKKLSSPDQLDLLLTVTRPAGWLTLAGIFAVLLTAVAWGIFGRIPETAVGQGILIRPSGTLSVFALGAGQVVEITVSQGDRVEPGQVVARLRQPALEEQLVTARRTLANLSLQAGQLLPLEKRGAEISGGLLRSSDDFLVQRVKDLEAQRQLMLQLLSAQEELVHDGLLTRGALSSQRQAYLGVESELASAKSQLDQNRGRRVDLRRQVESSTLTRQQAIDAAERQVHELEVQLAETAEVHSRLGGVVLDVLVEPGQAIAAGTPVVSLETLSAELVAVVYVPAADGKRVIPGMHVEISPSTIKREEHGYLLGSVRSVSAYPSRASGMQALLNNEELVRSLSAAGPPIAVVATLVPDAGQASGFRWSSRHGPRTTITTGTLCEARIVIRERAPISLVVPTLRRLTGLTP